MEQLELNKIYLGNCIDILKTFPDESINCCITSPPYFGLRNYGVDGQIGNENTPEEYIEKLVSVFNEVKRVLKDDGTLWLNLGDCWSGRNQVAETKNSTQKQKNNHGTNYMNEKEHKSKLVKLNSYKLKDLIGIPWMAAFALRNADWYLRQDIIWAKGNPMPESVKDRCTKSHEYIFLFSKNKKYYYDYEAIKEPAVTKPTVRDKKAEGYQADYGKGDRFSAGARVYGADSMRNKRDVWFVNTKPCKEAHFATFPDTLIEPCVLAGCPENGIVLDPFMGAGTTGMVAKKHNRNYVGIELNADYIQIAERRIKEHDNTRNQR